jgi:hypothetical protein
MITVSPAHGGFAAEPLGLCSVATLPSRLFGAMAVDQLVWGA